MSPTNVRLMLASLVSAVIILSAPFMGQIRAALRTTFPGHFVIVVGAAVAAAVAVLLLGALVRVRDRRVGRYAFIIAAVALASAYSAAFATGAPEVDVVERVHFVEYAVITLLFYRAWKRHGDLSTFVMPVLAGVLVGTLEEWFQWFIPNRVGEARDVLLNLVAIACGLLFSVGVDPPGHLLVWPVSQSARNRMALAGALAVVVFASFTHAVHMGHVVEDGAVGTFRSRYSRERLLELSRDRAVRWRSNPPLTLRRLSREDQYLDEGLWHVRRRNEAWAAQRFVAAWHENLILERYFAPVLDTPTYAGLGGHRWPADQRNEAAARGDRGAIDYVSDAEPYPILTAPKLGLWALVAALVAGMLAARRMSVRHGAVDPV